MFLIFFFFSWTCQNLSELFGQVEAGFPYQLVLFLTLQKTRTCLGMFPDHKLKPIMPAFRHVICSGSIGHKFDTTCPYLLFLYIFELLIDENSLIQSNQVHFLVRRVIDLESIENALQLYWREQMQERREHEYFI